MHAILPKLFLALALGGPLGDSDGHSPSALPSAEQGLVLLIGDISVPAQEAGLLVSVPAKEGDQVERNDLLASIDDQVAQIQKHAAELQLRAAQQRASNDIEVEYARAAFEVARDDYDRSAKLNRSSRGAVSLSDIQRLILMQHRARLQIEKSLLDLEVAKMSAEVHKSEVEATQESINRRQILSPIDGVVVEVYRQAGEWVNPGEPVMRVVRMDRLRVERFLNANEHDPGRISGRPVTVEVELAGRRKVQLSGQIVFVSPLIRAGNIYRVRAEVENRKRDGQWLLRPGMAATMTIDLR